MVVRSWSVVKATNVATHTLVDDCSDCLVAEPVAQLVLARAVHEAHLLAAAHLALTGLELGHASADRGRE